MKICVYAICKNEQAFAERWMASMGEADAVYVLDTGSTDDTVAKLTALGAQVTVERIDPWRFDTARNHSLALVPEDATFASAPIWTRCFTPAGGRCWKPRGKLARPAPPIATPGIFSRTAAKGTYFTPIRSTPGMDIAGCIPCMRC